MVTREKVQLQIVLSADNFFSLALFLIACVVIVEGQVDGFTLYRVRPGSLIRWIILLKKKKKGPLRGLIENTFTLIDCFTSSVEFEGRILHEEVEDQHTAVYMFELTEDENNKTLTTIIKKKTKP